MTDYSELVKRLRERAGQYDEYGWHSEIELEAADALEAQAKEIAKLEADDMAAFNRGMAACAALKGEKIED